MTKTMAEVLADHIPAASIGMFNFPNGGGNSRTCLCGERIEVMFTELEDDEPSTDAKLNAKVAAHQAAALSAAGFGLVADAKGEALEEAADAIEMQPPKLRAQYVATLRLYAAEPWRLTP